MNPLTRSFMYYQTSTPSAMSLNDLKRLIQTGEGTYLEFKRTIPSAEKIAREIAAFANSNGGTLLVGVDDDKSLIGVESYHEDEYLLSKAAGELCRPALDIGMEIIHYGERDIIVVRVEEAEKKPIYVKTPAGRTVYVRYNDQSMVATDERVAILKNGSSERGVTFEYGPNEQKLFRYLNEYGRITVPKFSHLINVTSYRASRILVDLVSAGVLQLFRHDEKEYYCFSKDCE